MTARKDPRAIANDVKEKYKTSPPQTCGKKEYNFLWFDRLTILSEVEGLKGIVKWQDFQEHLPAELHLVVARNAAVILSFF
jgi:hypothetical protein